MSNQDVKITWDDDKKTKENLKTKLEEKVEEKQAESSDKEQPKLQLFFENLGEIDENKDEEIKTKNENKKKEKEKSKIDENKSDSVKKDEQTDLVAKPRKLTKEEKKAIKEEKKILKEQKKAERREFDNIGVGAKVKAFGVQVTANVNLNRIPKSEEEIKEEIERKQKEFE